MHRPSFSAALLALAIAALGCGARASLLDGAVTLTTSSSAGTGGHGGAGGLGGAGGTGGVGGAGGCVTLTWAGDPVFLSTGFPLRRPRLIRTSIGQHALVFESSTGATLLQSVALTAWWKAWPPPLSGVGSSEGTVMDGVFRAVGRGEEGSFAVAVLAGANAKLVQVTPGGMGTAGATWSWSGPLGETKVLARANGGAYLVGYGPADGLAVDVLPGFVPGPTPTPITSGALACASQPIVAEAVGLGDDAFLLASTNDAPFDDCADPVLPGPPVVVQVLRVDDAGHVQQGGFVEESAPILDLQLAGRIGGAWLTYRADGDPVLHIVEVDAAGQLGNDVSINGNALYGDAVIAHDAGYAHALTWPGSADNPTPPFVTVEIQHPGESIGIASSLSEIVHPVGRPALASSDDGRSLLIAFTNDPQDGTLSSIGLVRADCAP